MVWLLILWKGDAAIVSSRYAAGYFCAVDIQIVWVGLQRGSCVDATSSFTN